LVFSACSEDESIPRPRGYFRIDLPKHEYKLYSETCPFSFDIPVYSGMRPGSADGSQPCWLNIVFPELKATLHLSYRNIEGNLSSLTEDSRNMAYKHTVKASGIAETIYEDEENRIFGLLYEINGNAASPLQFHATDSTSHFLRGSLYFNSAPNADSLFPVSNFLKEDVKHLISSLRWK
jgi:gliding motility-associated lipoprotein GldD